MDTTVTSVDRGTYLEISSTGKISNLEEFATNARLVYGEYVKCNRKKILLDQRKVIFPKKLVTYLDLVNYYKTDLPGEIREIQLACVVMPEFEEFGNFWETAAVNRGFNYHAFIHMQKAKEWLLK